MRSRYSKAIHRALIGIVENIELARGFVTGLDDLAFAADVRTVYAVTRCLEIISEASRGLAEANKAAHPSVPWNDIAGIGNILRHEYHRVEPLIIWNITVEHLPVLADAVEKLLKASGSRDD